MTKEMILMGNIEANENVVSFEDFLREDLSEDEMSQIYELLANIQNIKDYASFSVEIALHKEPL